MDLSKLVRDPQRVVASIVETDDGRWITKTGCKIYIPIRFAERNLATVGAEIYTVAIFAMSIEDKYFSTMLCNSMIRITPDETNRVVIGNEDYFEFVFDKGAVISPNINLVKKDTLPYYVFDEFINKVHIPWYLDYETCAMLLSTAPEYAGSKAGKDREVNELLAAMVSRDPNNLNNHYRSILKTDSVMAKTKPTFVPLRSVQHGAAGTFYKLTGSYLQDGLVSALVNPTEETSRIEEILRT